MINDRQTNDILSGLPGVFCHIYDILVFGTTIVEHDSRFYAALERIKEAGITLNAEKCQFSQPHITLLDQLKCLWCAGYAKWQCIETKASVSLFKHTVQYIYTHIITQQYVGMVCPISTCHMCVCLWECVWTLQLHKWTLCDQLNRF